MTFRNLLVALAAGSLLILAGCGGSSSTPADPPTTMMPDPDPEPSAYETAKAAIAAATTTAAAQAAYDAVDLTMVTAQEAMDLMDALNERVAMILADTAYERGMAAITNATTVAEARAAYAAIDQSAITGAQALELAQLRDARVDAIETAAREMVQRQALMDAAGMLDTSDLSTQALVDAARAAIVGLRNALDAADDVSEADKAMYMSMLNAAVTAVGGAQDGIDLATARTGQMTALSTASTALQTALAALSGTTPTQALLDAANDALTALNAALTGGTDLSDTEKAPYQREADNAAAPVQTAQTALDKINQDEQDAKDAAARAVVTKAATTKLTAMNAEAGQGPGQTPDNPDAGLGGSARTDADGTTTADDVYTLSIERDRDGTEVEITDPDQNNRADPKFEDQMAGLDDGRFMFARTQDEDADGNVEEEVVVVGTDIRAPVERPFARVHMLNARDLDADDDADGDGNDDNDFTAIFIGADLTTAPVTTGDDAYDFGLVMASRFSAGTAAVLTFDSDDTTTTAQNEAEEVPGTYNGASGTYRCHGATDCTVTIGEVDDELTITEMSAGWIFTPNANVKVYVADTSYLHYGFWLKKTTDEDGVLTYNEVETFAGASFDASTASELAAVTGTASYDGDAVGVYVHHVLSEGGGQIESSTAGHFKADANLMAHFGGTAVAARDQFTVTGTLSDFDLSGDEANDWMVNLNRADFSGATDRGADAGPGSAHTNTFSGVAEGGGASGSWSGTFHGLTPDADGDGAGTARTAPGSVVGEFNANMSNGSVAGAFGVNQ